MRDGQLDVGTEQDINVEITNIRFAEGLRDTFTNDITIPKTKNNIRILGCYNLLDSPNQMYGNRIQPAILTVDGYMMNCFIQVVSVNEDDISICLYELVLPNELRDKPIREVLRDTWETIFVWSVNTMSAYGNDFKRYVLGNIYDVNYMQYHPVKKVNTILTQLSNATGYTLPQTEDDLVLLAQNKNVCPENPNQTISITLSNDGGQDMVMVGGQHIVNDMEGWDGKMKNAESTIKELTFNRNCSGTFKARISWGRKLISYSNTFEIAMLRNNQFETGWSITTSETGRRNGYIESINHPFTVNAGDVIRFQFVSPTTNNPQNKFDIVQLIMDFTWTDYEITDEDYGIELIYCKEHPILYQWGPNDVVWRHPFDGRTEDFYIYNWDGSLNQNETFSLNFPWRGYSYFGYFCNLSEMTIGELLFALCWYNGYGITHTDDGGIAWTTTDKSKMIDGNITSIMPSSDYLGQKNYIIFNGQETETTTPLTEIPNIWLEERKTLVEIGFSYVRRGTLGRAWIKQYELKYEYDEDDNITDADVSFNDIDGQVAFRLQTPQNSNSHFHLQTIPPHEIQSMGLERMTSATQVEIETFDDEVSNKDYLYLDGRKYMVIQTNSDLINKKTTITALLVPTL